MLASKNKAKQNIHNCKQKQNINYNKNSVTYRTLIFKYYPVGSISEFNAIAGGVSQKSILAFSIFLWALVICAFLVEMNDNKDFSFGVCDIFALIGTFAMVLIGNFENDPFNLRMQIIHYSGAGLGIFCVFAFDLQFIMFYGEFKNIVYLIVPIVASVIFLCAFVCWFFVATENADDFALQLKESNRKIKKKNGQYMTKDEIKDQITKLSFQCIILESIAVCVGGYSLALYFVFMPICYEIRNSGCW